MTCQKIPYSTKKEARDDAKAIKIQQKFRPKKYNTRQKSNRKLYPYMCWFCDKWHLSTMKKRKG